MRPAQSRSAWLRGARCRRAGLSLVYLVLFFLVLAGFISLAVDMGRSRLTRVELQTAADAAARAGVTGLEFESNGVDVAEDRAIEAADLNVSMDVDNGVGQHGGREDKPVVLQPDEDIEFGIWRPNALPGKQFERLEDDPASAVDERREANAIRVWGRRVQQYTPPGSTEVIQRNTGLPLIFGPIIGVRHADIQVRAIAMVRGGRTGYGFVGIDAVKLNGGTASDSYNAATETYPGADGQANELGTIVSNGDITITGSATVKGDLHPGVDGSIVPNPLPTNVDVTGYMDPLDAPLDFPPTPFTPPASNYNLDGSLTPPSVIDKKQQFNTKKGTLQMPTVPVTPPVLFLFSGWKTAATADIQIDCTCDIFIDGDFDMKGGGTLAILPHNPPYKVRFYVNGNFNQGGATISNPGLPDDLQLYITKAGTVADVGGGAEFRAHVYAPLSDLAIHGNTLFYGWAIGKTLDVKGGAQIHYDETRDNTPVPYSIHLVK